MKGKKTDADTVALLSLMFEMGRRMKSALSRDMAPFSLLHVETLRFVGEKGTPAMREVADYLKVSASSATEVIDGLVKGGYITRTAGLTDRRKVLLALSKKGEALVRKMTEKRYRAFAAMVEPLTASDRRELARILTIVTSD
jgi:DNA-binding MarR family transcriptional regulator